MKLLNLKSGLLLLAIGSLSACGGGSGAPETGVQAKATISASGPGIDVSGSAVANVEITNVSLLNKAAYLNGAESVDVDIAYNISGSYSGTIGSDHVSDSVMLTGAESLELTAQYALDAGGTSVLTDYSGSFTTTVDGVTYSVTGSIDVNTGELRTDVDIVSGSRGAFFITNEGTGTQTALTNEQSAILDQFHTEFQDRGGNYATFSDDIAAAHAEGWTGSGIELILDADDQIVFDLIPNADQYVWDLDEGRSAVFNTNQADGIYVTSFGSGTLEGYYIDELTEKSHSIVAAGVGTVWNKFDTLSSDQIVDIVEATSDGNRFDLGAALSPVGNLN